MRDIINLVESKGANASAMKSSNPPRILEMVHGTDVYNAEEIVKGGFIVNSEWKNYNEDEEMLESLDGTYFAESLVIAIKYAYRAAQSGDGTLAIVEAEVDLNQAVPDEDLLMSAIWDAKRNTRRPEDFVRRFHEILDPHNSVPAPHKLVVELMNAYKKAEQIGADHVEKYRSIMDKVCHAYAHIILNPNPVMVYGRNVRLPNGLPPENVVSVTVFNIDEDFTVQQVSALKGQPIDEQRLQDAVDELVSVGLLS